jgi:SNF2 family DNA or RNA helicase
MDDAEAFDGVAVDVGSFELQLPVEARVLPRFDRPLPVSAREARLLGDNPWVRSLGKLTLEVTTEGWRFPTPADTPPLPSRPKPIRLESIAELQPEKPEPGALHRLRPPRETVVFKERLLYLLQPPLENVFGGRQVTVPFKPYPYQMEGIAFLMPRHAAILADEMGLGKTVQTILALRLMFHTAMIRNVLLVCPKSLVSNWMRELRTWSADLPFEVITGDVAARRFGWTTSKCPLKLVNYELLTRDADMIADESVHFDVVVLDEAQRIKNRESKTARAARSLHRDRSWALTGTPIENTTEDLVNLFAFIDEGRIPPETPAKRLPILIGDSILRRVKEDVMKDMPPKTIRDVTLELTPAQRQAYELAENEGVVHLNELGDTITVQHVFELVMRLKQICNFDPRTGQSAKLEQLVSDMAEVAASNRKAIIFSQWVEPLQRIAEALTEFGPLQFHGRIAPRDRQDVLDRFQKDPSCHVILMSYATGSVGLNLQFTNYVFLFDRWWNPAVEDQAINRAHRIGQKAPVFVTRFIAQDTIECRIAEVLEKKRELFNDLVGQNGPPARLGMTEDEIFGLFDIQARPRAALTVDGRKPGRTSASAGVTTTVETCCRRG